MKKISSPIDSFEAEVLIAWCPAKCWIFQGLSILIHLKTYWRHIFDVDENMGDFALGTATNKQKWSEL